MSLIYVERDARSDLLAESLSGRRCRGGYYFTPSRARKFSALHSAGWCAVKTRSEWRYYGPGAGTVLRLHEAMRCLNEKAKPLDGIAVEA